MSNIIDLINSSNISYVSVPKNQWSDIEYAKLSATEDIAIAIGSDDERILIFRDGSDSPEIAQLPIRDYWHKIAWCETLQRFCIISYDSDIFLLSSRIVNSTDPITWDIRNYIEIFNDDPNNNIQLGNRRWNDIICVESDITAAEENFKTFLITSRDITYALVAVIEEVAGELDIIGWTAQSNMAGQEEFEQYTWYDLSCTNIPNNDKTQDSPQFLAVGTLGNNNETRLGISTVEHSGNSWNMIDMPIDRPWRKVNYHIGVPSTAFEDSFIYLVAENGDICYSEDDTYTDWTTILKEVDVDEHISNITPDQTIISIETIKRYILDAVSKSFISNLTVADQAERYSIVSSAVNIDYIVYQVDINKYYRIINLDTDTGYLDSEKNYIDYYRMSIDELISLLDSLPIENFILYDEISRVLPEIISLTDSDVNTTIYDILTSLKYISSSDNFAMPYYTISKAEVRKYLPTLTDAQLRYSLEYMLSTGSYVNLTVENIQEYVDEIHNLSGEEYTGIENVAENIIDGIISYIMLFYNNPYYDGVTDKREYVYGLEDINRFDPDYANNVIFADLFSSVISDINFGIFDNINEKIIDYIINYMKNNYTECMTTDIINDIRTSVHNSVVNYISGNVITVNMNIINSVVASIALEILTDPANDDILRNIKQEEISKQIILNLLVNNIIFVRTANIFIGLTKSKFLAYTSTDLLSWNYIIYDNVTEYTSIIYIGGLYIITCNSDYILIGSDLTDLTEYSMPEGSNINECLYCPDTKKYIFVDSKNVDYVYKATINDINNIEIEKIEALENFTAIKSVYTSPDTTFTILTQQSRLLLLNALSDNWNTVDLSTENIILIAADYYTGNLCGLTQNKNIITSAYGTNNTWKSRRFTKKLDTIMAWGKYENSDGTHSATIAFLKKYGDLRISDNNVDFNCYTMNVNTDWVSICWSNTSQQFCAVNSHNFSLVFDIYGQNTKLSVIDTQSEMTDIIWINDFDCFMIITKSDKYLMSEDGTNWYNLKLPRDYVYSKLMYDENNHKLYLLAKKSGIVTIISTQ